MNRTCTRCGTQLQPDQGFCPECGTAWTTSTDTTLSQPPGPERVAFTPPAAAGGNGTNRIMLVSVIAIVVLAALGGGGWLLARERSARAAALTPGATTSAAATLPAAVQSAPVAAAAIAENAVPASATTSTDASAIAAASKPCSLVSQAEMEQILGMKVVNFTSNETSCSYFTDATMSVDIDSTWAGGNEAMAASKGYNANAGLFEPVAGIGDEAYMQAAGVLHVRKGDVYIVINGRQYPDQDKIETAIALKALEKLH